MFQRGLVCWMRLVGWLVLAEVMRNVWNVLKEIEWKKWGEETKNLIRGGILGKSAFKRGEAVTPLRTMAHSGRLWPPSKLWDTIVIDDWLTTHLNEMHGSPRFSFFMWTMFVPWECCYCYCWFYFTNAFIFFNWVALYARLNSQHMAWSYNKKKKKKMENILESYLERTQI